MLRKWILCFLFLFAAMIPAAYAEHMEVLFWNAGKADACLIRTENSTVLIDAGKNKFGKQIVSYLQENGIDRIDAFFVTHFDKDHVGGADQILENISVDRVYEPAYQSDSKQYIQYKEALEGADVSAEILAQNTSFVLDGVSYEIDVANRSFYGEDEENDFSLVISVRYGEHRFLFAGDAENPRLSELLSEGIGRYDVLKVPHHGRAEKLSASFFDAVQPEYAIITSDEDDLEEAAVVNALQRYGQVYLTRLGDVKCITDGHTIQMIQQKGGKGHE